MLPRTLAHLFSSCILYAIILIFSARLPSQRTPASSQLHRNLVYFSVFFLLFSPRWGNVLFKNASFAIFRYHFHNAMASILKRALIKLKINRKGKKIYKRSHFQILLNNNNTYLAPPLSRTVAAVHHPLEHAESTDTYIFNGNLFRMIIFLFLFPTHDFYPFPISQSHLENRAKQSHQPRGKFFQPSHTHTKVFSLDDPSLVSGGSFYFPSFFCEFRYVCFNVDDFCGCEESCQKYKKILNLIA